MKKHKSTNRKYKDGMFQLLFNDKARLLELFNALEGTDYSDPEAVCIETLSAALYNEMVNDLAFSVEQCHIVLTEHQSTLSFNMPARMLLYLAREYEQTLNLSELLKEKRYSIPTPHFYVLYNGVQERPPMWELNLSDSFLKEEEGPALELVVKVININESAGHPALQKSAVLRGYSRFVGLVRSNIHDGEEPDGAIEAAIKQCIDEDVLSDFLKRHGAEVANEMFKEYTLEDVLRIRGEEAEEKGMERGLEKGLEKGLEEGLEKGIEQGIKIGVEQGLEQGRELGREQGLELGREQGLELGREQGCSAVLKLALAMLEDGRAGEIPRLKQDPAFFTEMLDMYHIDLGD